MKKAVLAVVAIILLLPIAQRLIPKPVTFERVEAALNSAQFSVTDVQKVDRPALSGAIEQVSMVVNGAAVEVYRFEDEGKIVTQLEYQKPDAGSAIVETWNLSEALGAAKPKNKPLLPLRNRMFLMTITHEDKALRDRIGKVFKSL